MYAPNIIAAYSLLGAQGTLQQFDLEEELGVLDPTDPAAFERGVASLDVDFIVTEDTPAVLTYPPAFEAGTVTVYAVPHQQ